MYTLNKIITTNFVKVKNDTIFEISNDNLSDSCLVKVTTDNAPSIQVNEIKYYLDFMIKCGDIYTKNGGGGASKNPYTMVLQQNKK